jgi:hypothetical protein
MPPPERAGVFGKLFRPKLVLAESLGRSKYPLTAQLIKFDIITYLTEDYLELIRNLLENRETKIILWLERKNG